MTNSQLIVRLYNLRGHRVNTILFVREDECERSRPEPNIFGDELHNLLWERFPYANGWALRADLKFVY